MGLYMASSGSNRLTALKVKKANAQERYPDGNCLYLVVGESGAKHWLLRIVVRGKRRDMGLGSASLVDLEEARDLPRIQEDCQRGWRSHPGASEGSRPICIGQRCSTRGIHVECSLLEE